MYNNYVKSLKKKFNLKIGNGSSNRQKGQNKNWADHSQMCGKVHIPNRCFIHTLIKKKGILPITSGF